MLEGIGAVCMVDTVAQLHTLHALLCGRGTMERGPRRDSNSGANPDPVCGMRYP